MTNSDAYKLYNVVTTTLTTAPIFIPCPARITLGNPRERLCLAKSAAVS